MPGEPNSRETVSVVIPTAGRMAVCAAIQSALGQTCPPLEVLLVDDSPDRSAAAALPGMPGNVRVLFSEGTGANGARMLGVREAQGRLIAFLDDDDVWLPEKLERQLARWRVAVDDQRFALVSCRAATRGGDGKRLGVQPMRVLGEGERIPEYLFRRSSISYGEGCLRTSTFLCDRALIEAEPWDPGLPRHQDWDWVLRIGRRTDTAIRMCPEVLIEAGPPDAHSVSRSANWLASLTWLEQQAQYLTPREMGDFLLCHTATAAARSGSRRGACAAARRALRSARPGGWAWLVWGLHVLSPSLVDRVSRLRYRLAPGR